MSTETSDARRARAQRPQRSARRPVPRVRIGLLGLGTVGQGLCRLLAEKGARIEEEHGLSFEVKAVLVRDTRRERAFSPPPDRVTSDVEEFLRGPYDCVVEAIGGTEPAYGLVSRFLRGGVPVVTANKALLAEHGAGLRALAAASGTCLRAEAAVAAGIPLLSLLEHSLKAATVRRVTAILNGTSNFVLSRIARRGERLGEAVALAHRLGFAEADPTLDLSGIDAAQKLAILVERLTGTALPLEAIDVAGLGEVTPRECALAAALGYALKPVAFAELDGGEARAFVAPAAVPLGRRLAGVDDELNCVELETDTAGTLTLVGKGAGGLPTASSILDDLLAVARGGACGAPPASPRAPLHPAPCRTPWLLALHLAADAADSVLDLLRSAGVRTREVREATHALVAVTAPEPRERIEPLRALLRSLRAVADARFFRVLKGE
ncbi:MAG TPA: homoserine dehydrogenase [Planctomycetota bacterium]|nr:homoserine dehydrogenase [Planctomycetota bacterium]